MLVLLYPADTMQLSFRSLHINVAMALSLAACALLLKAFDIRGRVAAVTTGIAASSMYLAGIAMYEIALTLVVLPVAVFFVRDGRIGTIRPQARHVVLMALWFASAGVYLGYALWLSRRLSSYQSQVVGDSRGLFAIAREAMSSLFGVGFVRALAGGWIDAARMVATEFTSRTYLIVITCLIATLIVLMIRLDTRQSTPSSESGPASRWLPLRLAIMGVLLMLAGYAPFLASPSHVAISQRTYLWASPGAVLAWVGSLMMLWRLARMPATLVMLTLLFFGLGAQLVQLHHYVDISQRQRQLLKAIVENFDAKTPGETLLVIDGSAQLGHTWMFSNESLHYVLSYLYGREIGPFEVCGTPSMDWQRVDPLGRKGRCVEDDTGWTFSFLPNVAEPGAPAAPNTSRRLAKGRATMVTIREDGTPELRQEMANHREHLLTGTEAIDRRYRDILESHETAWIAPMFRDQFIGNSYRWDFGRWWSMDVPPRGAGWREVEWSGNGLSHYSSAWKMSPTADLRFQLAPDVAHYGVRGEFELFISDQARDRLRLRVNGQPVTLRWLSHSGFEAEVRANLLVPAYNRLEFISDQDSGSYGPTARLDWVEVAPR